MVNWGRSNRLFVDKNAELADKAKWRNKHLEQLVRTKELQAQLKGDFSGNSGGSSGGGSGSMSPQDLLKAYQDGVAASGVGSSGSGSGSARSIDELRAISDLDSQRMREEQNLQLQGQKEVLDQTRQARAAEKEQDFQYETRRRQREAGNAMAAYRNL
jgi:hypothetical protein